MTVKDVCITRFDNEEKVLIRQKTGKYYDSPFGVQACYKDIYDGYAAKIPIELFEVEVETLKPISGYGNNWNMVVFCK